jgi:hypothetical protein
MRDMKLKPREKKRSQERKGRKGDGKKRRDGTVWRVGKGKWVGVVSSRESQR